MTITVGTDSYISLADSNTYFGNNIRNDEWEILDDTVKERALKTATKFLDRQTWMGSKTSDAQALAWPRSGVTDRYGTAVSSASVPQQVKDAQCELALALIQDTAVETNKNSGKNIKFLRAGSAAVSFFRPQTGGRFPTIVQELIGQFMASAATIIAPEDFGTDQTTSFSSCKYGLTEGI